MVSATGGKGTRVTPPYPNPSDQEGLQLGAVPAIGAAQRPHTEPVADRQGGHVVRADDRIDLADPGLEPMLDRGPRRLRRQPAPPRVRVQMPADLDLSPPGGPVRRIRQRHQQYGP